jgi:nicotinamidase-related amidase
MEPRATALILVDVQYWTCSPDHGLGRAARERGYAGAVAPFYARVRRALPNLRRLLDAARAAGIMVVHVRTAARTADGRDLSPKLLAGAHLPTSGSQEGTILEDVAPEAGEVVLDKPASGVCTGTGLDEVLRNADISTVIMAGVSVDGAVEGSVRSLTDRGYGLFLVPDACVTFDEELERALWHMQTGIINVVSAADIARRLAAARPGIPAR